MERGSIRRRTMWALVLVGVLTALLVGAVSTVTLVREVYAQVAAANDRVGRLLLRHVEAKVEDGRRLLETAARKQSGKYFDVINLGPLLGDALTFHPIFDSIYAYDADEKVVMRRYPGGIESSAGRSKTLVEKNDPNFLVAGRQTLADGKTRTLPVRLSKSGNSYVPVITGVRGPQGKVAGMISGAISTNGRGFRQLVQDMAPGKAGYVLILDGDGRILGRTEFAPGTVGSPLEGTRRNHWGVRQLVRPGGVDFISESQLTSTGVEVLVALPREEALEALPGVLTKVGLTALFALALAGVLGVWLSERLTGPIRDLLEGIRAVGDGVLTHRLEVDGGEDDELAEVSLAFNRLAESLARNRMVEEFWIEAEGRERPGKSEPQDEPDGG